MIRRQRPEVRRQTLEFGCGNAEVGNIEDRGYRNVLNYLLLDPDFGY